MERGRPIADLNLIPLIDVSLILVIIFMVLTPIMVQSQITVKLPKATSAAAVPSASSVRVEIGKNGALVIEGRPVRWENLEQELVLRLPRASQKTLLVQADRTVPVERVVMVLDVAKKLGVGKLGIGVTSESH